MPCFSVGVAGLRSPGSLGPGETQSGRDSGAAFNQMCSQNDKLCSLELFRPNYEQMGLFYLHLGRLSERKCCVNKND